MRCSQIPLRKMPLQDLTNWVNGDILRSFGFVLFLYHLVMLWLRGWKPPQRTHAVSSRDPSDTELAPAPGTKLSFQEHDLRHGGSLRLTGWSREPGGACQGWDSAHTVTAQLNTCRWGGWAAADTWGRPVWAGNQAVGWKEGLPLLRTKCKGLVSRNQSGDGNQRL